MWPCSGHRNLHLTSRPGGSRARGAEKSAESAEGRGASERDPAWTRADGESLLGTIRILEEPIRVS